MGIDLDSVRGKNCKVFCYKDSKDERHIYFYDPENKRPTITFSETDINKALSESGTVFSYAFASASTFRDLLDASENLAPKQNPLSEKDLGLLYEMLDTMYCKPTRFNNFNAINSYGYDVLNFDGVYPSAG